MNVYKKTFVFPKVAYYNKRKVNQPEVEVELILNNNNKYELSICGSLYNAKHTDAIVCGQCLDLFNDIDDLHNNKLFQTLYRLWKNWHLNGMSAGTQKQMDALKEHFNKIPNYENSCDYLKSINLYNDNGNEFGAKWYFREIPKDDINLIVRLIS